MAYTRRFLLLLSLVLLLGMVGGTPNKVEAGLLSPLLGAQQAPAEIVGIGQSPTGLRLVDRLLRTVGWRVSASDGPLFRARPAGFLSRSVSSVLGLLRGSYLVRAAARNDPFSAGRGYGGHQSQFAAFEDDLAISAMPGQPGLAQIGHMPGRGRARGPAPRAAILDGGFDLRGEAVAEARIEGEFDAFDGGDDVRDTGNGLDDDHNGYVDGFVGHGTAALALIQTLAPDTSFLLVRVLDDEGMGSTWTIARGLQRALEVDVGVINLSAGSAYDSEVIESLLRSARDRGTIVVASAGNDGSTQLTYPARSDLVVGVTSVTSEEGRAAFSNHGKGAVLAAPGEGIVAPYPHTSNGYGYWYGTSLSTPIVAGAIASHMSEFGTDARTAEQALLAHAAPLAMHDDWERHAMGQGLLRLLPLDPGHE